MIRLALIGIERQAALGKSCSCLAKRSEQMRWHIRRQRQRCALQVRLRTRGEIHCFAFGHRPGARQKLFQLRPVGRGHELSPVNDNDILSRQSAIRKVLLHLRMIQLRRCLGAGRQCRHAVDDAGLGMCQHPFNYLQEFPGPALDGISSIQALLVRPVQFEMISQIADRQHDVVRRAPWTRYWQHFANPVVLRQQIRIALMPDKQNLK